MDANHIKGLWFRGRS